MENINLQDYIKDLSPELQEKAKSSKSISELLKFADENDIEIPQDALEKVSGGGICADPQVNGPTIAPQEKKCEHRSHYIILDFKQSYQDYDSGCCMEKRLCGHCNNEYYARMNYRTREWTEIKKEEYDRYETWQRGFNS